MTALKRLGSGATLPVYLLHGEEGYLVDRALETVLERIGATAPLRVQAGEDRLLARVEEALRTGSLFGGAPMAVVSAVERLVEAEQVGLLELLPRDGGAHLVLVGTSPDLRRKLFATCSREGWAFEFARVPIGRLPVWLREEARARGHELGTDAAELLTDLVGTDLRVAAGEIEKLSLYVGATAPIDAQAVAAVVGSSRARSMFELLDHIQRRNVPAAIGTLRQLLGQGTQPLALVAFLANQLRRLIVAGSATRAGASPGDLARRLGLSPWVAERLLDAFRRYDPETLQDAVVALSGIDVALKSSRASGPLLLDAWMLGIAGR
jgi:DNA polymerase-3 subunit delta